MFINFRFEVQFTEELKKIVETFGAFAAGTISTGLILDRNRQYLLRNLSLTKPLIAEALLAGALHDAKKIFNYINTFHYRLLDKIDNPYNYSNNKMDPVEIRRELEKL